MTPEDIHFTRKVWTVTGCALVAFWLIAAGVLALASHERVTVEVEG